MSTTEKIDTAALPMKIEFVAKTVKTDWGDKPWPCFEWRVTFTSKSGYWTVPYFCGMAHVKKSKFPGSGYGKEFPKAPSNADVLHSLISDASASDYNLQDWCAEFGYSDDSIRALNTYRQCLDIAVNLRKHLGADTVRALTIQLQDH